MHSFGLHARHGWAAELGKGYDVPGERGAAEELGFEDVAVAVAEMAFFDSAVGVLGFQHFCKCAR